MAFEIVVGALPDEALTIVKDVPIVKVGVEYQLASGPYTATFEDVADFVASQEDPTILPPRLYIGHSDDGRPGFRPASGEPALGVWTNIRLSENGTTALGDLTGVPLWLAKILPTAYPNRSMEGTTPFVAQSGKTYSLGIKAVALLGISWPGIACLDDLPIVFSAEGPEGVEIINPEEVPVEASTSIEAQVNIEDVTRAYWNEWAQGDRFYWWLCAVLLDPNELIVEDESGELYKLPFAINGETIEFGDEITPVKIEYVPTGKAEAVPVEASAEARRTAAIAAAADGRAPVAVYASRGERPRPNATKEGRVSTFLDNVKKKLRLASDASEAEVLDAIPEPTEQPDPAQPEGEQAPADSGSTTDGEQEQAGESESNDESGETNTEASATVVVDRATFEQVQRQAAEGARFAAAEREARDNRALEAAVRDGRIAASQREEYAKRLAADRQAGFDSTYRLLTASVEEGGLAPDTIPVSMRGHSQQEVHTAGSGDLNALFPFLNRKEGE